MTGEMDQLIADWSALAKALDTKFGTPPAGIPPLPSLKTISLSNISERVAADAIETIAPHSQNWEGWLRRESWVGPDREENPGQDAGAPLDGEWVSPDRAKSARLVHAGDGWRLITLGEGDGADGQRALREEVHLVAAKPAGSEMLLYAVYWALAPGPQERPALTRIASRFLGFTEG